MLNKSPLKKKFRILKNEIVHIKSRSFLKALSKEDGKSGDGTNPAVLILDKILVESKSECIGET